MPAAGAPWQPFDSLSRDIDDLFETPGLASWRQPGGRGLTLGLGCPSGRPQPVLSGAPSRRRTGAGARDRN